MAGQSPRTYRSVSVLAVVAVLGLLLGWYLIATGYDYGDLAGTYIYKIGAVSSTLRLNENGTFEQILTTAGKTESASGGWRRIGEGGVNFSINFMRVPGAKTFIEVQPEHPDGSVEDREFYGHFERVLGLYPELHLDGDEPAPTFYKKYF